MRHEDAGMRCLVAHEQGHGQCIKCTCGDWVDPRDWETHSGGGSAAFALFKSRPDIFRVDTDWKREMEPNWERKP